MLISSLVPFLPGPFVVGEIGQRHHAGVVHEHVDRAESVESVLRRRFDLRHICHIRNMSRAFEAGRP